VVEQLPYCDPVKLILQKCHRTHGRRVARHGVANFLKKGLESRGYSVIAEPSLQGENRMFKPDRSI